MLKGEKTMCQPGYDWMEFYSPVLQTDKKVSFLERRYYGLERITRLESHSVVEQWNPKKGSWEAKED